MNAAAPNGPPSSAPNGPEQGRLSEKDLRHWKLIDHFQDRLEKVFAQHQLPASWEDPKRRLDVAQYLSLFLFGLLNPVARTLRGLTAASQLQRVQEQVCGQRVARATFSDAQHLLDPALLEAVLDDLGAQVPSVAMPRPGGDWVWQARDGSLFRALPRMAWALYGAGKAGSPNRAVRLHLSLNIFDDKPAQATVRPGRECERAVWEEHLQAGVAYIADRYFAENYQLFGRLEAKGCAYVIRLMDTAVINIEEPLPLSDADKAAGITGHAWVRLGRDAKRRSCRLRVVWVRRKQATILLATNLSPDVLSAQDVCQLYWRRWDIELYFRWIKCILGCGHWLAESPRGVAIQLYLALIAGVLLQLYTGRRPNKRMMELIQFYLLGVATLDELERGLQNYKAELERRKNP